jgi:hypothetical protein
MCPQGENSKVLECKVGWWRQRINGPIKNSKEEGVIIFPERGVQGLEIQVLEDQGLSFEGG